MLGTEHLPTTIGAFLAGLDASIHMANFIAFSSAGFADFSAKLIQTIQEMRAGQLKIGRCLANFGAVQHQAQMFRFDMLSAGFNTMIHRCM
jgi:hypothetical protein